MSRIMFASLAALLPLSFAWGAASGGELPAGGYPVAGASGPSCDIRVVHDGGNLVLEGVVFAPAPASGTYDLQISQGGQAGSSNIRQGGDFAVAPGDDGSLGMVSLPGRGGYAATLIVHWHDGAPACTRHVGTGRSL